MVVHVLYVLPFELERLRSRRTEQKVRAATSCLLQKLTLERCVYGDL